MASGIYEIRNSVNGNAYIGSSCRLRQRIGRHFTDLRGNRHDNQHFQASFNKYGEVAFTWTILELCEPDRLIELEQKYIDERHPQYNIAQVAGTCRGVVRSAAHRAAISAAHKGRKASPETRARISEAAKGRIISPERRAAIAIANAGRQRSDAEREKLRIAMTGRIFSAATIQRMSDAQSRRGGPDAAARAKIAAARKANHVDRPCQICGELGDALRLGRCHACSEYFRRNKIERTARLTRDPLLCANGHVRDETRPTCKLCNRDATRRYRARMIAALRAALDTTGPSV